MTSRVLSGLLVSCLVAGSLPADDPKPAEGKAYDKLVVDTLRDVHNKGADLYNEAKDFVGAYRIYQGALLTVRPLMAHQPSIQKAIDTGLADAEKEPNLALKAFKLHETIEAVRSKLKIAASPAPKPEETKKPAEKKTEKKPDPPDEVKKPVEKKPTVKYEVAPLPREKK
jgi:hypothetical protein